MNATSYTIQISLLLSSSTDPRESTLILLLYCSSCITYITGRGAKGADSSKRTFLCDSDGSLPAGVPVTDNMQSITVTKINYF